MTDHFTRRDFLRWASAGAGAAAVGGVVWRSSSQDPTSPSGADAPDADPPLAARSGSAGTPSQLQAERASPGAGGTDQRTLVVIELSGGNDGLSTLVPHGIPGYYDLRTTTAVAADELVGFDDETGLHPSLARVGARGLAVVQGVGSWRPDGSHFEMMRRWWAGDNDGTAGHTTGFLGRLADAIGDPAAPAVALTIGAANHPALVSRRVSTLALPTADATGYLVGADPDDVLQSSFQRALHAFGAAPADDGTVLGRLRQVGHRTIEFAGAIDGLADHEDDADALEYPGSTLGEGLRLAADLVAADNGVRIIHVPMGADFDTHDDHLGRCAALLDEFDVAVDAFLTDLDRRGLAGSVLVMTTSEFGRRARDNGSSGLDHGTASMAVLLGPVAAGRFGAMPSLLDLDDDDNLVATVGLDSYYATVAEGWFGVPASEVLTGRPEILGGIFT
jgi:uncharacterized protein (DUF1501 family)